LQDQALPETQSTIEHILERELGAPFHQVFASFDLEPIACASIGQVHRAFLVDGTEVAVKVQRPDLDDVIAMDMITLRLFLESMRSLLPPTDLDTIADEIERAVLEELDYNNEAFWLRQAATLLDPVEGVRVPRTIDHLCTRHVLTTEFIRAEKLSTRLEMWRETGQHDAISRVLNRLLEGYFCQVLRGGFFQADPHPGNLLVTDDHEVVILDFGCTMELPAHFHQGYRKILQGVLCGQTGLIGETLLDLGFTTRSGKPDTLLLFADALLAEIRTGMQQGEHIQWPTRDEFMQRSAHLLAAANQDPVDRLPAEFIMLARVFGTLGGLFTHYQPKLNMAQVLLPYLKGG
jgi:ubiquinone biosynthesis protein